MKSKWLESQKGITLVALVVTIIGLIILAGIAISMTVGENGIFTKAKEAKRLQITAEAKEKNRNRNIGSASRSNRKK